MPESKKLSLSVQKLSQQDVLSRDLICGTSGALVRWVVGLFAIFFGVLIYYLVLDKPEVSNTIKYICIGMYSFALLALLINGRMKSGWPAILRDEECLYITYDPINDEFLRVPFELIAGCEKKMLFPNTMAVSVLLKSPELTDQCLAYLKTAIYPAEDAVHVHSAFNNRNRVIADIRTMITKCPDSAQ